jgi:RHS repeat-associated protein
VPIHWLWGATLACGSLSAANLVRAQAGRVYAQEGAKTIPANSTGLSTTFRIDNITSVSTRFILTRTCTGAVASCSGPSSVTIPGNSLSIVTIGYSTNAIATGRIKLRAADASGNASDSLDIIRADPKPSVTPDGDSAVARPPNWGGFSEIFTVKNVGAISGTFSLTCAGAVNVTCTGLSTNSVTLAAGVSTTVTANYTVGALGTGRLTLNATGSVASDSGFFIVPVVDQSVQVTPDAGAIAVTSNTSHSFAFTVKNIGTGRATYTTTPTCTAPMTCTSSPGTVTVNAGDTALYNVSFTAGASGTGTVQLHAAAGPYSDDGSINVTIAAVGTPTVALANSDSLIARDLCFNARLGDAVAYSCGDVQVVHGLPATTTMGTTRAPILIYNSQHARPMPLVAANVSLPGDAAGPDTIVATVTLDSVAGRTWVRKWPGTMWNGGIPRRIAVPVDSLPPLGGNSSTRIYAYSLDISGCYNGSSCQAATRQRGSLVVVDRAGSLYGAGWWISGLERLDVARMIWTGGDGSVRRYSQDISQPSIWRAVAITRPDSIVRDIATGTYVRYAAGGARVYFNGTTGVQDSTVNILGHRTRFTYVGAQLRTIELPTPSGAVVYTLDTAIVSGKLAITAPPVGGQQRLTTLQIASGRLNSITDPDDPNGASFSTLFGYSGTSALLVSRRDRATGRTAISYDVGQRVVLDSVALTSLPRYAVTRVQSAESRGVSAGVLTDSAYALINGPRRDTTVVRVWIDRFGSPTVILNALGQKTEAIRGSVSFPALVTELHSPNGTPTGFITQAVYDSRGRMTVQRSIDAYGDARTDSTRYEWHSSLDRVTKIVPPELDSTTFGYNSANGTLIWEKNARGDSTAYAYTSAGLIQSAKQPVTPQPILFFQDALGNVRKTQSPLGFFTLHLRDAIGRDTLVVSPTEVASATDSTLLLQRGVRQYTRFDLLDRDTLAITVATHQPQLGTPATDTQAVKVRKQFDGEGRVVSLTRSTVPATNVDSMTTLWTYDLAGRDTAETAPDGQRERRVRDDAGNVVQRWTRRGLSDAIRMQYDALNRMTTRTTPAVFYAADGTAPQYDQGLGLTLPSEVAQFTYAPTGGLESAINADAKVYRHYFNNGQLKSDTLQTREWGTTNFTSHVYGVQYAYDRDGRRRMLRHPSQLAVGASRDSVVYQYASWGPLSSVTGILGVAYSFDYDANGRLVHRGLPGQVTDTLRYDADDRLIGRWIRGTNYVGQDLRTNPTSQTASIVDDSLWYDARGKVLNAETMIDSIDASYSGLGTIRKTWQFHYPRGSGGLFVSPSKETYDHDALGAQISLSTLNSGQSYTYDRPTGRLKVVHATTVSGDYSNYLEDSSYYDTAGNLSLVNRREGVGNNIVVIALTHYYYDALDQLRAVDRASAWDPNWNISSRKARSYEETRYDALGRRVLLRARQDSATYTGGTLASNSTIARYVWDGAEVLYEIRYPGSDLQSAANLERDTAAVTEYQGKMHGRVAYTTGTGIDQPLALIRFGYMSSSPIGITLYPDWRGNISRATTPNGVDVSVTIPNIPWIDRHVSAYLNNQNPLEPLVWVGDLPAGHETTSGLMYRRSRMLDPVSGRFTQEDPIGLAGGANLYGYAGGDPVSYSDPFGLCPPADTNRDDCQNDRRGRHKKTYCPTGTAGTPPNCHSLASGAAVPGSCPNVSAKEWDLGQKAIALTQSTEEGFFITSRGAVGRADGPGWVKTDSSIGPFVSWPRSIATFIHSHPSGSGISPDDVGASDIIGFRIISAGVGTNRYGSYSPGGPPVTCNTPTRP